MLAFDLETVADDTAISFLPPLEAAGNLKDPEKIKASIVERTANRLAKLALDPDCCRIVCLGYTEADGEIVTLLCQDTELEAASLDRFWQRWATVGQLRVGFNCVGFDLPVLIQRSRILGVPHPELTLRKYGSPDVRDMMLELAFNGLTDYKGLAFWCKRLRLAVPDDAFKGSDIAALVEAGLWGSVAEHCHIDIQRTVALAQCLYASVGAF